ncbi:MAG: hypothetical protein CME85_14640 [Henriciella sp.]|nr:hypothetical protein [Henriciella sp.]MBK76705.1 hypothetical protein [Henriciella sp.]PHR82200.1 MAG: hypothetical protein COA64_02010 [Henriciella sp.]
MSGRRHSEPLLSHRPYGGFDLWIDFSGLRAKTGFTSARMSTSLSDAQASLAAKFQTPSILCLIITFARQRLLHCIAGK